MEQVFSITTAGKQSEYSSHTMHLSKLEAAHFLKEKAFSLQFSFSFYFSFTILSFCAMQFRNYFKQRFFLSQEIIKKGKNHYYTTQCFLAMDQWNDFVFFFLIVKNKYDIFVNQTKLVALFQEQPVFQIALPLEGRNAGDRTPE